ncbi:MAG: hypothetical protein N2747_04170 [Chitinophagaceae bacterium]|nr:hypothetical protein [Chitinophagaceae bacterium]
MKRFFLFMALFVLLAGCDSNKEKNQVSAEGIGDDVITPEGLGKLKLGATISEVENVLHQKLHFKEKTGDEVYWPDTVEVIYNNQPLTLYFERSYSESDPGVIRLFGIITKNANARTDAGVTMKDSRIDVVKKYLDPLWTVHIGPDFEQDSSRIWKLNPRKYSVSVYDTSSRQITFYFYDDKMQAIKLSYFEGGR